MSTQTVLDVCTADTQTDSVKVRLKNQAVLRHNSCVKHNIIILTLLFFKFHRQNPKGVTNSQFISKFTSALFLS